MSHERHLVPQEGASGKPSGPALWRLAGVAARGTCHDRKGLRAPHIMQRAVQHDPAPSPGLWHRRWQCSGEGEWSILVVRQRHDIPDDTQPPVSRRGHVALRSTCVWRLPHLDQRRDRAGVVPRRRHVRARAVSGHAAHARRACRLRCSAAATGPERPERRAAVGSGTQVRWRRSRSARRGPGHPLAP